jgi:DNA-3-methyladenine glycosylase II
MPRGEPGDITAVNKVHRDDLKTILTTNTTWGGTKRMAARLAETYGAPLPGEPTRHAFPTPERLAQATVDDLKGTVKLGCRAPYVLDLAQRVAAGELDVEEWKTAVLPTADLRKQLLALKGVGPYAAAHLLMFLGHQARLHRMVRRPARRQKRGRRRL